MTTCQRPNCRRKAHRNGTGYCTNHAYSEGVIHPRVSAEPARQRVNALLAAGANKSSIARAANITPPTMTRLCAGAATISLRTHKAIMSLTTPPAAATKPAIGYNRRIRALRAAGHSLDELANHTGLDKSTIIYLSTDRWQTINQATADRIDRAWAQLAYKPVRPPSARVAKYNWPLPMDWDNIDDPDEPPAPGRAAASGYIHRRLRLLVEEIGNPTHAAAYIGIAPKTIYGILSGKQLSVTRGAETKINRAYHQHRSNHQRQN